MDPDKAKKKKVTSKNLNGGCSAIQYQKLMMQKPKLSSSRLNPVANTIFLAKIYMVNHSRHG